MGQRGLDGLFPCRRQAAPDGADPSPAPPCRRGFGVPRMALRGVLQQRRRSRRDAVAPVARRRRGSGGFARGLDARAPASAAFARRRAKIRAASAMGRRAVRRPASGLLQAHHRGTAHRRVAAAGRQGAGRGRRRRGKPHGAAHDRLFPGAANALGGGFRGADRRGGARRGAGARRRPALSILSRPVLAKAGRGDAGDAGASRRMDRRMEVRRHPRAAPDARRKLAALVARRGTDFRRLPRSRAAGAGAALGGRARRRARGSHSARGRFHRRFARRPRLLRQPAAEARPKNRQREDDARIAGRLHRLRSSRVRGAGHPQRAAAPAPRPSRKPGRADACFRRGARRSAAFAHQPDGLGGGLGGLGGRPGRSAGKA